MWSDFFSWPSGGVWANLIANIIWLIPAYFYGHYHIRKIHIKNKALHDDIKRLTGDLK